MFHFLVAMLWHGYILVYAKPESHAGILRPGSVCRLVAVYIFCIMPFFALTSAQGPPVRDFPWLPDSVSYPSIEQAVAAPQGWERVPCTRHSFGAWLRSLPVNPDDHSLTLYHGRPKSNQQAHAAILAIDVGDRNLQQCADAVMRLRAEYLYSYHRYDAIGFHFTSGDLATFRDWIRGVRPSVHGNRVDWVHSGVVDSSYDSFRRYLNQVFIYAGSYSLQNELDPVADSAEIKIGDVFVQGGFPGHAVIIVDMIEQIESPERRYLLAQSYMPAQEIHILKNPIRPDPWYILPPGAVIATPEWVFRRADLKRFPHQGPVP